MDFDEKLVAEKLEAKAKEERKIIKIMKFETKLSCLCCGSVSCLGYVGFTRNNGIMGSELICKDCQEIITPDMIEKGICKRMNIPTE